MSAATIVLTDRLDQLLAPPREIESDLATVMSHLFDRKYTGQVVLHYHDGVPKKVELPAPKIKLT